MTDLRKAAEMALEALEWNYGTDLENIENCMAWLDKMNATIPALRQALAQPEQDELLKQGWRQCAVGQRTTQYCGMAEQARLEEREACAKLVESFEGPHRYVDDIAAAIRARGEK